jgi:hypothetical protein
MGERGALLSALGRTGALLVAALALWGGLLLLSTLANAWGEGLQAAFARLRPVPGASMLGWLAPLSVIVAIASALALAALLVLSSARRATHRG